MTALGIGGKNSLAEGTGLHSYSGLSPRPKMPARPPLLAFADTWWGLVPPGTIDSVIKLHRVFHLCPHGTWGSSRVCGHVWIHWSHAGCPHAGVLTSEAQGPSLDVHLGMFPTIPVERL